MISGSDTECESDADLSEVRAGSAILPNLTIAIERDDDPGIEIRSVLVKVRTVSMFYFNLVLAL